MLSTSPQQYRHGAISVILGNIFIPFSFFFQLMLRRTERLNQFISITNLSLNDHIHTKSPSSSIEWEWGFDRRTIGYLNPPPHPPSPPHSLPTPFIFMDITFLKNCGILVLETSCAAAIFYFEITGEQ